MSATKLTAKAVGVKALSPTQIMGLVDGAREIVANIKEIAVQRTEQERIREQSRQEVERIHAFRDVMLDYLDRSFDERRENFQQLFARLDKAIETENVELARVTLDAVVHLADSSPFKALSDTLATQRALGEKGKDWGVF